MLDLYIFLFIFDLKKIVKKYLNNFVVVLVDVNDICFLIFCLKEIIKYIGFFFG